MLAESLLYPEILTAHIGRKPRKSMARREPFQVNYSREWIAGATFPAS